jgi:hypothetical protein
MSDFITDTYKEDAETHYKLIFNTKDREVFDAMQTLARRMIDRQAIKTNYEYLCTRTPEEMSYILAGIVQECDEKAANKLRKLGIDVTLVSLAIEIDAQLQLQWLNEAYTRQEGETYESNITDSSE